MENLSRSCPFHRTPSRHSQDNTEHCYDFDLIQQNLSRHSHALNLTRHNQLSFPNVTRRTLLSGVIGRPLRSIPDPKDSVTNVYKFVQTMIGHFRSLRIVIRLFFTFRVVALSGLKREPQSALCERHITFGKLGIIVTDYAVSDQNRNNVLWIFNAVSRWLNQDCVQILSKANLTRHTRLSFPNFTRRTLLYERRITFGKLVIIVIDYAVSDQNRNIHCRFLLIEYRLRPDLVECEPFAESVPEQSRN